MKIPATAARVPHAAARARRKSAAFLPAVDGLEARRVLSAQALAPPALVAQALVHTSASTSALNQRIVNYLAAKVGSRIGSGECAAIATEALRVAGGKFVRPADSPGTDDYVWGTLVKVVTAKNGKAVDSAPSASVQVGDIIQYRNARFSSAGIKAMSSAGSFAPHHTSVVAAVDSSGRPTKVYEQNFGGVRKLAVHPINLAQLSEGWVRIYHPVTRTTVSGRYEFTVVNNATSSQTIKVGSKSVTLTAANTTKSAQTYVSTGGQPTLTLNGKSYKIVDAAGYQIVGSGKSATLKKIT